LIGSDAAAVERGAEEGHTVLVVVDLVLEILDLTKRRHAENPGTIQTLSLPARIRV
jgi:hypothetical protein